MNASEIRALLDEPACHHNHKEKSGCARPKPGATAGGCAFDGAQIALLPIADVAHIVHGPIACAGNSWDNRGAKSSGAALYRIGMTTDLSETDIVMGRSEKRLFHAIRQAIETYRPAAVFVYATCVTALMGDDLEAVCKAAAARWGVPVIPVDAAGFYGTKNLGNRLAGEAMFKYVIGTREPDPPPAHPAGIPTFDVNLIGEYNIAGEFWRVAPLFDELGLRILGSLSGDARFCEVQTMHRARATMVVCAKAMLNVARKLRENHGVPFFEGSFYGVADTSRALRDFARVIGDAGLAARVETLVAREEAKADAVLQAWRARLAGKRVLLYTGGVKSWSIVSALQDLGMTVVATGTKKSTEEDKARIRELMGEDAKMIDDGSPQNLLATFHDHGADILIAGGRNLYTALKARIPFLDINQEREFAYAGYDGMPELARQLALSIESPVWRAVRQTTPWRSGIGCRESGIEKTPPGAKTAEIRKTVKALSVTPLKSSQPLGAALAFLGLARAVPLMHGSQGCTAFGKVFFVRHFREPIPLHTTAIDQISAIMGADENIIEALRVQAGKNHPDIIGLLTTGLSETQGADIRRALKAFRAAHPAHADMAVVPVNTPDFSGCLETGFALGLEAIIDALVPPSRHAGRRPKQVNVLASSMLTPGDVEAVKEWVEAFGLHPVVLPDLADALDGHLTEAEFSPLTLGGTPRAEIARMGESAATLVIGASLDKAADILRQRTGVPDVRFGGLLGLAACDAFTAELARISGQPVPPGLERQRDQLRDAMVDCHFMLGFARVAIAADPDLLAMFSRFIDDMGGETVAAVTPVRAEILAALPVREIIVGDLEDLERRAGEADAQLLIGNSHTTETARRLSRPLLHAGFPQYDLIGGHARAWMSYRGSRQALFDIANLLQANANHVPGIHQSLYWRGSPRAFEGAALATCAAASC
ncbi:MAG: nitrogenase iron-molybdenum cofactor biosynthesis protein NifE [Azoarcus sp.]|jgi:nitrogenase molybdenum-cofactor synthesis protein NifE|nr:nitrogenase iron-molybdenum cofactor biosynthesis protein NifE [Azoarcus sp.]